MHRKKRHPPQVRCDGAVSSIGAATARRSCSCAPAPWSEATPPWRIVKDNGAQGAITGTTRKGEPQRAWHLKHHATDRNAPLSYHAGSGQLVKPLRLESSSESLGIRPRNDNSNQKVACHFAQAPGHRTSGKRRPETGEGERDVSMECKGKLQTRQNRGRPSETDE